MAPVSFFTAINYGSHASSFTEILLEKADDYFFLGGKKAQVIDVKIGDSVGTVYFAQKFSLYATVLKIASYCNVIIPGIVLITKVILRSIYQFHLNQPNQENIGLFPGSPPTPPSSVDDNPPNSPPNFPRNSLIQALSLDKNLPIIPFNTPMQLSTEQIVKLHLKAMVALAFTSHEADVTAVCNKAISELPQYQDSFFYFEKIQSSQDYLIERKKNGDASAPNLFPLHSALKYNETSVISGEDFVKLGLNPLSFEFIEEGNYVTGRSNLPAYQHVKFTWQEAIIQGQPAIEIKCEYCPDY